MAASELGDARLEALGDGWRLRAEHPRGAGIRIEGPWDWSGVTCVAWEAWSGTNARVRVTVEHGERGRWVFYFVPKAGLRLCAALPAADLRVRPRNTARPGYFTFGGGPDPVDLADVRALRFEWDQDGPPAELRIQGLRGAAAAVEPAVLDPRSCVDAFGQWTGLGGAPRPEAETRAAWAGEGAAGAAELPQRSRWGGDARHRLEGTGRFRVDRLGASWCLVDPDGHPFFSVGPDCVNPHAEGPTGGKEGLFAEAPSGARLDFYARNLRLRHGADAAAWVETTSRRLRAWGFNTIGNWSAEALWTGRGMPWVAGLRGIERWCHDLPDVFDPAFAGRAEAAVRDQVARHRDDAALIGYFVGNEPLWTFPGAIHPFQTVFGGRHPHTAAAAVDWLRGRYDGPAAAGLAWDRTYGSWEDLLREGPPDPRVGTEALRRDAAEFTGAILARFYGACCGAVRAQDPGRLLLGARFYSVSMPEPYLRACSVFDVVSFNCYTRVPPAEAVARMHALTGRPALIGEFHFGVCGRGMSGALITVADDAARGEAYAAFVRSAAADPAVVGAHWFQWVDEPVTGRFDGEDYNIGLVDVTDLPYAGLAAGAERAHREMYRLRFGG